MIVATEIKVLNNHGEPSETLTLPQALQKDEVNTAVLHQTIVNYQANLRQGNASTKVRSQVSGGGKKPFRQKGTGRARQGSTRSPLWVGGGVVFGPHPRDFSYSVPKKLKRLAFSEAILSKIKAEDFIIVDDITDPIEKTKLMVERLDKYGVDNTCLFLVEGSHPTVLRSVRNVPYVNVKRVTDVNAYDILKHKILLITKSAFNLITERIEK